MKATNLIILGISTVLAVAVACSKKSGADAQTPEGPQNFVEVADVSKIPNFEAQGVAPSPQEAGYGQYAEARFGKSCQVQRNQAGAITAYNDVLGFDRSLNVEDTTYVTVHLSNQSGSRHMQQNYLVKSIQDFKTRVVRTTYSMSSPEAGGEILLSPVNEYENCVFVNNEISCLEENKSIDEFRGNMTAQGFDYLKSHSGGETASCSIRTPSGPTESKTEFGRLRLQNGQSIHAFLTTEVVRGPVICGTQILGEGQVISYEVTSLAVKSIPAIREIKDGLQTCGGAKVISSHVIQVGGKVIESYRFEQVQPALR
jgi:hypothetical protein